MMAREIDVTITVQYDYSPPEPDVNLPDARIEFDREDAIERINEAILEDIEAWLEPDDPPRREE